MKENYLRDVTIVQEGEEDDGTRYQKTIYFNYKDESKTYIDESSFTWYGFPDGKSEADYAGNKGSFGSTKLTDANIETNLPSISSGLVGTALNPGQTPDVPVKNRYLMPIAATTISASNGTLYNSYGW